MLLILIISGGLLINKNPDIQEANREKLLSPLKEANTIDQLNLLQKKL